MFTNLLLFYLALILVFVLPGYFLMRLIFLKKYNNLSSIEKLFISFSLSLASTDFLMLLMNYLHIFIGRKNLILAILGMSTVFFFGWKFLSNKFKITPKKYPDFSIWKPSYRQSLLFFIILFGAILIRSIYLMDGIFPKTTDLGHHAYWANYISINGSLSNYSEKFIIGEHLPFAAINIITRIPYISPFMTITLFLFNIFTLLVVFALSYYLASYFNKFFHYVFPKFKKISSFDIAIWSLFIIGIMYPISAPQAKFISGGVIGNVIGNFLLIVLIYSFFRAIILKNISFVAFFLINLFLILYTHHLSSFIFIYSFLSIFIGFLILLLIFLKFNFRKFGNLFWRYLKLFFQPIPLLIMLLGIFFLWQVRTPSYLNPKAIDVAVGTPTKITRVGFNFSAITARVGAWRLLFAIIFGIIFLPGFVLFLKRIFSKTKPQIKKLFATNFLIGLALSLAILFSWGKVLFLMSWKPGLLKIDIPSKRIITYLTYPIAIMSSFGFVYFLFLVKNYLSKKLATFLFLFFLSIGIISGFGQDISSNQRLDKKDSSKEAMQTYLASMYLAKRTSAKDMILKDHKFLKGDSWMKLFFMRGYKYPLSRTYDRRYNDIYNQHETCTRDMIAQPNSIIGKQCFEKTHTKYIVLKRGYDDAIFKTSKEFQLIYASDTILIFERISL